MSADMQFMCIAAATNAESRSFEEVRVEDYLRFYQTTGGPPPPVPQEPTDEFQRKTLNLPPLFKPQTNVIQPPSTAAATTPLLASANGSSALASSSTAAVPTKPKITNPTEIPLGQEFKMHIVAGERYQCITCSPEYEGFSVEELRYYAYLKGNTTSPVPITMDPFVPVVKEAPAPTPPGANGTSEDSLQSQCALPDFMRHSPEELRVAYLLFGREMTSTDLLGPAPSTSTSAATPAAVRPSLFGSSTSTISQPVPPPVIATAGPAVSTPRFSFGFR